MINSSVIAGLKTKYSNHMIYYVNLDDIDFVYRDMTQKEYKDVTGLYNKGVIDAQEHLLDLSVIYNHDETGRLSPGGVIGLFDLVMEASGFASGEDVLEEKITRYRGDLGFLIGQATALICHVFNYKIEEVDTFTYDQLLRGMTLAEYILNTNPTYGEFKLGFPWDKQGNAAIPNPPKPMTHNQKKMTVPMEQLQENSTKNARSALNKTLKETNGQAPKKTFDWQNDN